MKIRLKKQGKRKIERKEQDEPDFYFENGLMVFTENYHKKRGYCCKSGCRHCPFGFTKNEENLL